MSTGKVAGRVAAEARARVLIDRQLVEAGWSVQDKKAMNLFAAQGVPIPVPGERLELLALRAEFDDVRLHLQSQLATAQLRGARLRRSRLAAAFSGLLTGDRAAAGV